MIENLLAKEEQVADIQKMDKLIIELKVELETSKQNLYENL